MDFLKRTWAEINLDALKQNYQAIRDTVRPETEICWVVKADAYGHGAVFVARTLERMGAKGLRFPILKRQSSCAAAVWQVRF